jgi:hypothetical protein
MHRRTAGIHRQAARGGRHSRQCNSVAYRTPHQRTGSAFAGTPERNAGLQVITAAAVPKITGAGGNGTKCIPSRQQQCSSFPVKMSRMPAMNRLYCTWLHGGWYSRLRCQARHVG